MEATVQGSVWTENLALLGIFAFGEGEPAHPASTSSIAAETAPMPIVVRALFLAASRLANIDPKATIHPLVIKCIANMPGACRIPGTLPRFSRLG